MALLSWTGAVVARACGWAGDGHRFTVGTMSGEWLRQHADRAAKHPDAV